jgi:RND family efflux transporter MFP subunit
VDVRAESSFQNVTDAPPRRGLIRRALIFAAPLIVLAVAALGVAALMMTAAKPEKSEEPPLPIAVEIATARAEETTLHVSTQGEVRAKTQAEVAAQVAGVIVEISPRLEPGAFFTKGEILARIDPDQYRLAVDRSRSQVARAREALARAQSEAELAERDWRELGLSGDPSELTLQKPQVNSALAELRTAEAAVKEAELNLDRTTIRAPFAGRVTTRAANVGDFISPGAPIAAIFAVDVAQVRVPLTDSDLAVLGLSPGFIAIEDGPRARLRATVANVVRVWEGRLSLVEATVDPATRLVYGLVEVEDPFGPANPAPLAPGLFVDIEIDSGKRQRLVSIPRGALKKNQYVYVVDREGAIKAREVAPAMANDGELFFRNGLRAGERVVVSYLPSPRDGMKVRDINAPPPKRTAGAEADEKK